MSVEKLLEENERINRDIDKVLEENEEIYQQINETLENVSRETLREERNNEIENQRNYFS